jgi:NADPH2:quinone reductase
VLATDSPEARCQVCRDLGADRVIDYRVEDFVEVARQEGGANVILDIVGGPNIEKNFKAASPDARIIQLAFALGSKVEVNLMPVMLKRLTYTGSTLRTRPPAFKARIASELEAQVWPHIEAGRIRPVISTTFPLAEASKAHAMMESAGHVGKILLVP